ncbi:MAG TPA: polysaccharide pyruvyl transferase family protein [Allosphingosinicella sp.]
MNRSSDASGTGAGEARAARPLTILGAYGGVNSGDEMILRAVVRQARRAGYRGPINVVAGHVPAGASLRADYLDEQLVVHSWRDRAKALRAAAGRDLFIGGGQLIDGAFGINHPLVQTALAMVARATGGKVAIGGVSTARLESPKVRMLYRLLFGLAGRIAARDEASLADILAIAPSAATKSERLADMVFALADELGGGRPVEERRALVFAVHHAPHLPLTDMDEAAGFLGRAAALAGEQVELKVVAHDHRPEWDLDFARRLAARAGLPGDAVRTLATTAECADFYRAARSVVSVRMHPIILGACAGAYCVPVKGSRKQADLAGRLGLPSWSLAEMMALDDMAFGAAVGIGAGGPRPDRARLERLSEEARAVLAPAAGAGARQSAPAQAAAGRA